MAKKQGYGRQSANVPTGDYRGYKRAIEERRRSMGMDTDETRYSDYARENAEDRAPDMDEVDAAAASAYALSASQEDGELADALGQTAAPEEDEDSMPAPRRRARAYRSGQPAPRVEPEPEPAQYEEPQGEPEPEPGERPVRRTAPRGGERRHAQPERREYGLEEEPARAARPARKAHHAPRDEAEGADELEDYRGDDAAYSDDVYAPYEYEDDAEGDYEEEGSATEWADGIKRALDKGKAGFMALRAKAAGGKKRRPAPKKRPAAQRKPRPAPVAEELPELAAEETTPVYEQSSPRPARRVQVDMSEYDSVSRELESIDEPAPVMSRRERRMLQEQRQAEAEEESAQVSIVSRKAMRAQQEEAAAEAAPEPAEPAAEPETQPAEETPAPEEPAQAPEEPADEPVEPEAPESAGEPAAEESMMFGIQGRQHIMQPAPEMEGAPVDDWSMPVQEEPAAEPQPEFEPAEPVEEKPARERGSKKSRKGRKEKGAARRRDFDLDDDDEDDFRAPVSGDTAVYKKTAAPRARISDDDDEPEDDFMRYETPRPEEDASAEQGFEMPDNGFSGSYDDDAYAQGYQDDDYEEGEYEEEPEEESRGGCLKAFTVLLVILLILFGGVWALDYFGIINVRSIASDVLAMPVFDPLRGSLLPAATAPDAVPTPESGALPTPEVTAEAGAAPTIQPASNEPTAISAIDTEATAAPTDAAAAQLNATSPETDSQANLLAQGVTGSVQTALAQQLYLEAHPVEEARPDRSAFDLEYGVYVDYERDRDYSRDEPISFGQGSEYTNLEGVITFRGNNFRENAAYGTASLDEKEFKVLWKNRIGSIDSGYAVWSGVGWNGQPVMIHWSDAMRQMMNIDDRYADDSELVEVIYGTLDGNIYFLDSRTGDYTRDPIKLGFPIKGSVSIDPRGYPLLYVGQGISKANGKTGSIGWRVYNLLNQEHMYLLNGHDELRFRTHGSFDGVCLLDAETDTIIEGAENGIFYTIKLNTNFNWNEQTISIDPVVTLYRYKSRLSRAVGDEGLGIENSVAAYGQYAYFVDNSGLLTCIDLNTMAPAWLFDVGDDTDASISLEQQADGTVALYTINEVDKQGKSGYCTMRKLNALTGEQLWSYSVKCKSDGTNGGGGFASPALGQNSLSELVYFNAARTDGGGTLYAFNKMTGEIVWSKTTGRYSWSSPVLVYNEAGEGVVILGNSGGVLRMYDGLTGKVYDEIEIDGNMEGSPAVYNDTLVIGTRDCKIYGIQIL